MHRRMLYYNLKREFCVNILSASVTLYKCGSQKPDCSRCVVARPELDCIWCDIECKLTQLCTAQNPVSLSDGQNCPSPVLTMVSPLLLEENSPMGCVISQHA